MPPGDQSLKKFPLIGCKDPTISDRRVPGRIQMNQTIFAVRTVLMVFVAGFCLTGVAAAEGAQKIDACTLLTKVEIQAAVGQNVGDGKLNAKANPAVGIPCDYVVGDYGAFSILIKTTGPGETADKTKEELKKMKIAVADASSGIGDSSFLQAPAMV